MKRSRLILASASPRRRDLLRRLGVPFSVRHSRVQESAPAGLPPHRVASTLAREKAADVASRLRGPGWVLGSDTLVVAGGRVLGKPRHRRDAARMLRLLGGRWHHVITAVAVVPAGQPGTVRAGWSRTGVRLAPLDDRRLRWLLAAEEHGDKAGAYALQGRAGAFVREVRGSASGVVGLPLELTARLLAQAGLLPWSAASGPGIRRYSAMKA